MKKIKVSFNNPKFDFFAKSLIGFFIVGYFSTYIFARLFYFIGRDYWESGLGGGWLLYFIYGFYSILISFLISNTIYVLLVLFLNKKLMSGDKLNAKTKLGLFLLSIVFYITTLFVLYFINTLL